MSTWEDVWGLWWLWRAPGGLVGLSQPVEGGCLYPQPLEDSCGKYLWV